MSPIETCSKSYSVDLSFPDQFSILGMKKDEGPATETAETRATQGGRSEQTKSTTKDSNNNKDSAVHTTHPAIPEKRTLTRSFSLCSTSSSNNKSKAKSTSSSSSPISPTKFALPWKKGLSKEVKAKQDEYLNLQDQYEA